MLNKKEAHEVFGKVWKEFNKVRKNNTDDGWSECVKNVDELHSKYDNKFYEKIMLIVIKEADRESKLDQNTARTEYKKRERLSRRLGRCLNSLLTTLIPLRLRE